MSGIDVTKEYFVEMRLKNWNHQLNGIAHAIFGVCCEALFHGLCYCICTGVVHNCMGAACWRVENCCCRKKTLTDIAPHTKPLVEAPGGGEKISTGRVPI